MYGSVIEMLDFILGGAGTGKTVRIISDIKKAAQSGEKCLVIVPDQFSFEYDKKLYDALGAAVYNSISVFSFSRLAKEMIFKRFGGKKGTYASEATKLALTYLAVKRVEKNDGFLFYNSRGKRGNFTSMAADAVKELHWAGISAEALAEKSVMLDGQLCDKVTDISNVYTAYLGLLEEKSLKDSLFDISDAAVIAAGSGCFDGMTVFIDEFQSFSADEYAIIKVLLSEAKNVTVALPTEDLSGKLPLFSIVNSTRAKLSSMAAECGIKVNETVLREGVRFLSEDIALVSSSIFRAKKCEKIHSENVKTVKAGDTYKEAEYVCAEIRSLMKKGMKCSDIAILARNAQGYSGIFESTFERYDIPYFIDMKISTVHKAVMLFVTAALEYGSKRSPSTEGILRYAKTGILGVDREDIAALDNFVYCWGIDGDMWLSEFKECDEKIELTRRTIIAPLEKFREAIADATGKEICRALYILFAESGAQSTLSTMSSLDTEELEIFREQKMLWNMLSDSLDELYEVLGDEKISPPDFAELFGCIARESTFASPPQTLDAVTLAGTERARLDSPKAVFIIGANDGVFPADVKGSGIFCDREKRQLSEAGIELETDTEYKLCEERFFCYKALSSASEKLYIVYPMADSSGAALYPSYTVRRIEGLFENDISVDADKQDALFYSSTKKAAFYNYIQNYDRKDSATAALRKFLLSDEEYAEKIRALDRISFDTPEKISDRELTKKLFGEKLYISPSRFEEYQKCPFMYFCKKGLNIFPLQRMELNPASSGTIVHECLYDIFTTFDREDFLSADADKIRTLIGNSLDRYYNEKLGGEFAKSDRFNAGYNAIKDSAADIALHIKKELAQAKFYPKDCELEIKSMGKVHPYTVKTSDGIEISFIGKVDRVDAYKSGDKEYVRVVDYKTGEKKFDLGEVYYGINLQMLMYLFTITHNQQGDYKGVLPAGVLYMPAGEPAASLDRSAGEELVEKKKDSAYKMNGIVLADTDVIQAMEENLDGVYIPVTASSEGFDKKSDIISAAQLENLRIYVEKLTKRMAESLYGGAVEASPFAEGKKRPCDYCEYWSVCGKSDFPTAREYDSGAEKLMKEILDGGKADD